MNMNVLSNAEGVKATYEPISLSSVLYNNELLAVYYYSKKMQRLLYDFNVRKAIFERNYSFLGAWKY